MRKHDNKKGLSKKNNTIRKINTDKSKSFSDEIDIIEGRNPVTEVLKSKKPINKIMVSKGEKDGSIRRIIAMAKEKGVVIQEVDRKILDKMSHTYSHQGVIAHTSAKEYVDVDEILKFADKKKEQPFLILLDEIKDPNNLGAIIRTAEAVGVHGIIIPKRRAAGITTTVSKVSAGALEHVLVSRVNNLRQTIDYLKKKNIWIIGTEDSAKKSYRDSDLKCAVGIVIGSEGYGISKKIKEECDYTIKIPMKGKISSLNASVSAAIIMYEVMYQRENEIK